MAVVVQLLRSDLRRRWRSLAALLVLVAIVVTAVLATTAGARRSRTAFDRYLDNVNPSDAILLTKGGELILPSLLADIDGIQAAIGYRWLLILPEADLQGFYPMFVPDDPRVPDDYLRYPLVAGRLPDPREPLVGTRSCREPGATT